MEQMKSYLNPGDEVAENLFSVSEKDFSEEAIVVDDYNELNDVEEEVNVCDTCGVLGYENMLVICHNCGIGAEHTYCMAVKPEDVPEKWSCYDCVEDTGSIKEKSKSSVDLFEMGEAAFQKQNGNPKLLNLDPSIDLNANPYLDLNVDNNLDLSLDCGSTSNSQAHTRMRASPNPLLGYASLRKDQRAPKRRRVDT